ncbi:MAG: ATP-binding protein [Candidatus Eremiobacterota bacterium]
MADLTDQDPASKDVAGLPVLGSVLDRVEQELAQRAQVGFIYFDVVQFHTLVENYGAEVAESLRSLLAQTLVRQRGRLFRDEDLVAVGGAGSDYFVIYLFSPPRRKDSFSPSDLKMVSFRVLQKLTNLLNERAAQLGVNQKIDLRSGYTVIKHDPRLPVDKLVEEARKEAALKSELEEILVTFVSNVSHELRTPLTCIKGYAETLLEGAVDDRELTTRWLTIISEEARRLERLIHDLLDLSMIEAQQVALNCSPVSLPHLAQRTVDVLSAYAQKGEVTVECDAETVEVRADEDRISQVLTNLLDNAIKYSHAGGLVTVRVRKGEYNAVVEVQDRGAGIPEQEVSRVFERFYRVEKGRTARFGGRGLGLAIAKNIVEAHGGELQVESKLGEGSTFRMLLPFNADRENWMDDEG